MAHVKLAVKWRGMDAGEQAAACQKALAEPIIDEVCNTALHYICREAFYSPNGHPNKEAQIPAAMLRERLPKTRGIIAELARNNAAYHLETKRLYRTLVGIVLLCEEKEKETGKPCTLNVFFAIH